MDNITSALNLTYAQTKKGIIYPDELLAKFNLNIPFDQEVLSYIKNSPTPSGLIAGGYYHYLTFLVQNTNAKLIVELGNRYGVSTMALYHGLKEDQKVITIDTVKDQRYVPEKMFNDQRIKFVFGDCLDLSSYTKHGIDIPVDIDILWTDTVHYYEQIQAEFTVYEPLLSDEALILIDDIKLNDKGRFFAEAPYTKYDLTDLCHSSGFGVIHYVRPLNQRGLSKETRINIALERTTGILAARYWDLFNEHEKLKADYKARSLKGRLRKALRPAYHALKGIFNK